MRNVLGLAMMALGFLFLVGGVFGGLFVGLYIMLYQGIILVYDSVAVNKNASDFAMGVIMVLFCAFPGWGTFFVGGLISTLCFNTAKNLTTED